MEALIHKEKTFNLKFIIFIKILGLDYMIDEELRIYLIEVNTNPCLDTSCNLLARLIPNMLENAFRYKSKYFY